MPLPVMQRPEHEQCYPNRLLKKSQASARQGKNWRKSAVYMQYMSILSQFLTQDCAA